jgi:hypothetical protein
MVAELRSGEAAAELEAAELEAADGGEELEKVLPVGRVGSGLIGFLL